jgi:FtsP/CotA-like multicopper oxidase with cupredoxin domain
MSASKDVSRRSFMGWSVGLGGSFAFAGSATLLGSCGGTDGDSGDGAAGGSSATPGADIAAIDQPSRVTIEVQARRVQWVVGKDPAQPNAWVYAADGVTAASGVLANHLGPTINVRRGASCVVTWTNTIPSAPNDPMLLAEPPTHPPPVLTICGARQLQSPVGVVTHLHGARVDSGSDGWPLTPLGFEGNPYGFPTTRDFVYPNRQRSTLLWYHDHAMDRTGRNVHAGLAGLYVVRDEADDALVALIGGASQELPCVLQDRILGADQTTIDFAAGIVGGGADDDATSRPEFLGSTNFVNGHPAGTTTLTRRVWRLRVLNGANTRTFGLALCDPDALGSATQRIWYTDALRLIGADGGLLARSLPLKDTDVLVITPAQRRDVLVDLSAIPQSVTRLRLVNVALAAYAASNPRLLEGLFSTHQASLLTPTSPSFTSVDLTLYGALNASRAALMDITLEPAVGAPASPGAAEIDRVLLAAASDDDFVWSGTQLTAPSGAVFGPNRLVLLVTNTQGWLPADVVNGVTDWNALQLLELGPEGATAGSWALPFAVDLQSAGNPAPGAPSGSAVAYSVLRRDFFARARNADITAAKAYPALHAPAVVARAGTYERWYVANLGSSQPLAGDDPAPEMHPFHIHGLQMVATRRWLLDGDATSARFVPLAKLTTDLYDIARQDTVTVPSGQLIELLVHFPVGYSGDFPFHCHLLEHEDLCMMSHLHVTAA